MWRHNFRPNVGHFLTSLTMPPLVNMARKRGTGLVSAPKKLINQKLINQKAHQTIRATFFFFFALLIHSLCIEPLSIIVIECWVVSGFLLYLWKVLIRNQCKSEENYSRRWRRWRHAAAGLGCAMPSILVLTPRNVLMRLACLTQE